MNQPAQSVCGDDADQPEDQHDEEDRNHHVMDLIPPKRASKRAGTDEKALDPIDRALCCKSAPATALLSLFLNLQIIVYLFHALHLLGQLFRATFLVGRFDDTIKRHDTIGRINIDAR